MSQEDRDLLREALDDIGVGVCQPDYQRACALALVAQGTELRLMRQQLASVVLELSTISYSLQNLTQAIRDKE